MKNNLMKIRNLVLLIISLVLLFLIFIISLSVGSEKISFFSAMKHFSEATDSLNFDYIILFELRLPRCLLAMISGALLAGAGAVFQMFFRNPLAEPGIIGISSGATLGAVVSQSVFNVTAITVAFSSVSSFSNSVLQ
ncbi:MAG: iron ABC transporter permease [Treponema sp.]|nr:iron ABC transporter permease [Treponema sp.]